MRTHQILVLSAVVPLLAACGGGGTPGDQITAQQQGSGNIASADLSLQTSIADAYCKNQRKLQVISNTLLSAYAPKDNGVDAKYCGGENVYTVDGANFTLKLNNYCMDYRGEQYTLNASIAGSTDSGSNFISSISDFSITGKNVDLSFSGETWDGRADDNHVTLDVYDALTTTDYSISESSVKKGEFDFGNLSFPGFQSVAYKFITHFNADNTEGLLFIYGNADDKIIISADNGIITAVYSANKHDPGTWLELPCNQ